MNAAQQIAQRVGSSLVKAASDAVPVYHLAGRLYLSSSGWLLLKVPNALGKGAFDALDEPGVELPTRDTDDPNAVFNAHISVMSAAEVESIGGGDKITERGHMFRYTLGPLKTVSPKTWNNVSKVWYITVFSPALRQLRKSYGLTPQPKGDWDFHITVAIKRTGILHANSISKASSAVNSRHGGQPGAQRLEGYEDSVLQREKCSVSGLRWSWDHSLQSLAMGLRRLSEGHGPMSTGTHAGSSEQPQGVLAEQLSLGEEKGAESKQAEQSPDQVSRPDENAGGVVRAVRSGFFGNYLPTEAGLVGSAGANRTGESKVSAASHVDVSRQNVTSDGHGPEVRYSGRHAPLAAKTRLDPTKITHYAGSLKNADLLPGGLADGKPDSAFDPEQLAKGRKVEKEHTSVPALPNEIAKDHLTEDPKYYDKLEKMEGKAAREFVPGEDCRHCGASMEKSEAGYCNSCGHDYDTGKIPELGLFHEGKQAELNEAYLLQLLKQAESTHTATRGKDTYDILKLIELLKGRPTALASLDSLKVNRSRRTGYSPKRMAAANTTVPGIVDEQGQLIDGRHRAAKMIDHGQTHMPVRTATLADLKSVRLGG